MTQELTILSIESKRAPILLLSLATVHGSKSSDGKKIQIPSKVKELSRIARGITGMLKLAAPVMYYYIRQMAAARFHDDCVGLDQW